MPALRLLRWLEALLLGMAEPGRLRQMLAQLAQQRRPRAALPALEEALEALPLVVARRRAVQVVVLLVLRLVLEAV